MVHGQRSLPLSVIKKLGVQREGPDVSHHTVDLGQTVGGTGRLEGGERNRAENKHKVCVYMTWRGLLVGISLFLIIHFLL